jgi:hypothetical protein
MKLQLSLEFLIYVVISGISLAVMLGMFVSAQSSSGAITSGTYLEEFVALINANMAYRTSSFSAYVPRALCGATVVGTSLAVNSIPFELGGRLEIEDDALCKGAGGIAHFRMEEQYNGSFRLYV